MTAQSGLTVSKAETTNNAVVAPRPGILNRRALFDVSSGREPASSVA